MKNILFVPAVKKMLKKIQNITADAFIIDLEDSISVNNKEDALNQLKEFLESKPKNIYIRLDRDYLIDEIKELRDYDFKGYMLPKFEKPSDFDSVRCLIGGKKVIALVETPLGVINIETIASCDWVDSIAFGAEDFTTSIGMKNSAEYLQPIKSKMVLYAKAYCKPIFDTPSLILDDNAALEREIQIACDLGFDGKLAIHPCQCQIIDKVFNGYDTDYIRYVIKQYEATGKAVARIDGKVYEKMHINYLKNVLNDEN